MELKFETLSYQHDAVQAVVRLFCGEQKNEQLFDLQANNVFVGNRCRLTSDEIGKNLNAVQQDFRLPETQIDQFGLHFSIEMETGTGKTYVYLRTIFELNKQYGWRKFVIVVPSVAIREGVLQSLGAMKSHFQTAFDGVYFSYSVYDSSRLSRLNSFATNTHIDILIMNIDAFKKEKNVIRQENESGEAPIRQISQTNPIVIMDEPQNMETELAKQAIDELSPLFVLRYSATHKEAYHKIYSLNPVQAYQQKLVKQIEVLSVLAKNDVNGAYLLLKGFDLGKKQLRAKVELHSRDSKEVKKKTISVKVGDDLFDCSGENESYRNMIVNSLNQETGEMTLSNGQVIRLNDNDDVIRDSIMKKQIEHTIKEHLKKEKRLNPQGIKVLSLFFIDKVANYRENGKFFRWFEEIYERETGESAEGVHDGYFSQDNKGKETETKGNSKNDEATYHLIMKNKEKLLSFESKLRFIFSHSALKEGWDNPNVFQICTLNETHSPIKKRQEIGRGLRLAVNQEGSRVRDESVNILTLIPNESYESFAANLQKEYQDECGVHFAEGGVKNAIHHQQQTYRKNFTIDENFLRIWKKLCCKTSYKMQFKSEHLIEKASCLIKNMPTIQKPQLQTQKAKIDQSLRGIQAKITFSQNEDLNCDWEIPDVLREIQQKTNLTRQTIFKIIKRSEKIAELSNNPQRFVDLLSEKIALALHELMVDGIEYFRQPEKDDAFYTQSLAKWRDLEKNGGEFFQNQYTFSVKDEGKTIFEKYIALDSATEKAFAKDCEQSELVSLYFKLPLWFYVPTPIGRYHPDWAVVMNRQDKVYFVAETKNTGKGIQEGVDFDKLRLSEQQKIHCAKKHFTVFDDVAYRVVQELSELY